MQPSDQYGKRKEHERKAEHHLKATEDRYVFDQSSGLYKTKTPEAAKESQQKQPGHDKHLPFWAAIKTDRLVVTISTLTLLLLLATVIFARRQWKAIDKQYPQIVKSADAAETAARTAETTMMLTYQPRVRLLGLGPSRWTEPNKTDIHFVTEDHRLRMSATLTNFGTVSAINVRYFTFWGIIGDKTNARKFAYAEDAGPFGHPKEILPKAAGMSTDDSFFTVPLSPKQIEKISDLKVWEEFSVLITYDDNFGSHHATEYCDLFLVVSGTQDICPWTVQNY